jgi:hypothetical protein
MIASHKNLLCVVVVLIAIAGCRFGGPQSGAAGGDASAGTNTNVDAVSPAADVLPPPPAIDAAATSDAVMTPGPGPSPDASGGNDLGGASDGQIASCGAPFPVQVCDPVCNSGCAALLRCDVSDIPQTGACVGIWIGQVGDACFKGSGTDSCAIGLTCVDAKCAKLCHADRDCSSAGTCCTRELEGTSGKLGFKICAAC